MFQRISKKLALDYALLDARTETVSDDSEASKDDLEMILRKGASDTFTEECDELDKFCGEDIETILEHRSGSAARDFVSGGRSLFAKGSFAGGNEAQIDFNNEDFWKKLLPKSYLLGTRRAATYFRRYHDDDDLVALKKQKKEKKKKQKPPMPLGPTRFSDTFELMFQYGCKGVTSRCLGVSLIARSLLHYALMRVPERAKQFERYVQQSLAEVESERKLKKTMGAEPFTDSVFLSVLFRNRELKLLETSSLYDRLFTLVVFMSEERFDERFEFALAMPCPPFWGPCNDYGILNGYVCYGLDRTEDVISFQELVFPDLKGVMPPPEWIVQRRIFLIAVLSLLIPP